MAGGEHGNQRHVTAQRRARIVELRDQGLTFPEIAAEVGLALSTTWQHYQNAMRDIPAEIAAAHADHQLARKAAQLRRIDMQREIHESVVLSAHKTVTVAGKVLDEEDLGPVFAATDRLVKLDNQEAELLGLKAEQKLNLSGGVRYELVGIDPADLT